MLGLYAQSTNPTRETCARSHRSYGAHRVTRARPYISSLINVDNQVGISDLSEVWEHASV